MSGLTTQAIATGQLVQEYREVLLALGGDTANQKLARRADVLEEEILRRMAWLRCCTVTARVRHARALAVWASPTP